MRVVQPSPELVAAYQRVERASAARASFDKNTASLVADCDAASRRLTYANTALEQRERVSNIPGAMAGIIAARKDVTLAEAALGEADQRFHAAGDVAVLDQQKVDALAEFKPMMMALRNEITDALQADIDEAVTAAIVPIMLRAHGMNDAFLYCFNAALSEVQIPDFVNRQRLGDTGIIRRGMAVTSHGVRLGDKHFRWSDEWRRDEALAVEADQIGRMQRALVALERDVKVIEEERFERMKADPVAWAAYCEGRRAEQKRELDEAAKHSAEMKEKREKEEAERSAAIDERQRQTNYAGHSYHRPGSSRPTRMDDAVAAAGDRAERVATDPSFAA